MQINTNTLNHWWWFLFWGWAGWAHRGVLLLIPAQDEAVLPLHLLHPVFTDLLEYITSQHVRLTNIYLSNQARKNILNFKGHEVGCLRAPFCHKAPSSKGLSIFSIKHFLKTSSLLSKKSLLRQSSMDGREG